MKAYMQSLFSSGMTHHGCRNVAESGRAANSIGRIGCSSHTKRGPPYESQIAAPSARRTFGSTSRRPDDDLR